MRGERMEGTDTHRKMGKTERQKRERDKQRQRKGQIETRERGGHINTNTSIATKLINTVLLYIFTYQHYIINYIIIIR